MKKAVIIGGGIGGLASAKVLSAYFDRVTVYDAGEASQSNHLHVLMRSGQDILFDLFPDIKQKLINHDCPEIDWAQDTLWENHLGRFPQYPSSVKTLSMGRSFIQKLMREECKNVEFIEERLESIEGIEADIIVVSGGQNFPLKDVFVFEKKQKIDLTYRSFQFKLGDLKMNGFKQYYFQMDPPFSTIGGVISPMENGLAMATLIEKEATYSPCQGIDEFLLKASQIGSPRFLEIIHESRPVSKMAHFRKVRTHRRKLDLKEIPKNVYVIGDVLTSLNPIFGQGMTHTLMQVELLRSMCEKDELNHSTFHIRSHEIGHLPHMLSLNGSREKGCGKAFLRIFLRACQCSKMLHHQFLRFLHSLNQVAFK